jgi:hypothetical protein
MFASLQLPPVLVELAAIAEVSVAVILDAAAVSTALLSFLLHAATAIAATARVATLMRESSIVRPLPKGQEKTATFIESGIGLLWGNKAKSVHTAGLSL